MVIHRGVLGFFMLVISCGHSWIKAQGVSFRTIAKKLYYKLPSGVLLGIILLKEGEQGRLPVLILSMKQSDLKKRPAIVFIHSSYKCKEWLRPLLEVAPCL